MKIKTSELTGDALGWAVAEAYSLFQGTDNSFNKQWFDSFRHTWMPHVKWSQGGPIIERERIRIEYVGYDFPACKNKQWAAELDWYGPTPLIAAMRCFVASKLGDEVEIPKEIL